MSRDLSDRFVTTRAMEVIPEGYPATYRFLRLSVRAGSPVATSSEATPRLRAWVSTNPSKTFAMR